MHAVLTFHRETCVCAAWSVSRIRRARGVMGIAKECGCGSKWTYEGWSSLAFGGTMVGLRGEVIELRHCTCQSTLAIRIDHDRVPTREPRALVA